MRRIRGLIVAVGLILGCATASHLHAQQGSSTVSVSIELTGEEEARLPSARSLARVANPPELLLRRNMEGWEMATAKRFANDPTIAKLKSKYPEILGVAMDAARPIAQEYCRQYVEQAVELMARVLAKRLTAAELEEAFQFHQSPAGQRLVTGIYSTADLTTLVTENMQNPDDGGRLKLSSDAVRKMDQDARQQAVAAASEEDQQALLRYSRSAAASKVRDALTEVGPLILRLANNPHPMWLEKQGRAAGAAIVAFVQRQSANPKK